MPSRPPCGPKAAESEYIWRSGAQRQELLAPTHPILGLIVDNMGIERRVFARVEAMFFHLSSMAPESARVIGSLW